MNFSELYAELIEVLAENSTTAPQYWSIAQLKKYLNKGNKELTKRANFNSFLLPLQQAELGAYYMPDDILKLNQVYYLGKALDHKSVKFLDAFYGGTGHQQIKSGDGVAYSCNWRNETGDPIHWYYENGKVKLYPKPEASVASTTTIRGKITGSMSIGDSSLTLAGSIPLDQNRVNLFIGGVYQNKDQWSITNASLISFTGWAATFDNDYEVVYIPDTISLTTVESSEKYIIYLATGDTKIIVPGGYTQGIGALEIAINGVTISSSSYTETTNSYVVLTSAVLVDSSVEIQVTRPDATQTASVLYIQAPVTLVNDSDVPAITNEDWQEAIVHYAAYRALIKEGKLTQDLQKAQIHLGLFNQVVSDAMTITDPEVDVAPSVEMPFFL